MFSPTLTLTFDPVTVIFDRVFVSFCTPRSHIGAYTRSKCISFIKTTASILTKFSTTLNTTMRLSWVVQIRAKGIQDGGRISTYCLISMTLARYRISGPYSGLTIKVLNFCKPNMEAASMFKITKTVICQQQFDRSLESWHDDAK